MFCSRSIGRGGVTLVEMMIALIITLMIVFAMVEAFRRIGETTTDGRASIEMLGQIRTARVTLEEDISRCTIPVAMRNPRVLQPGQNHGYYELIEGTGSDSFPDRYLVRTPDGLLYNTFDFSDPNNDLAVQSSTLFGDLDDILCLTMRNDEVPFRGRMAYPVADNTWGTADDFTSIIESNLAEVIWWAELNDQPEDVNGDDLIAPPQDNNSDGFIDVAGEAGYGEWNPGETFTIRRRVLLIRPDLTIPLPLSRAVPEFLKYSDVSVHYHYDVTTQALMGLQANSLGDLTFRWNRVAHIPINGSPASGPPANGNVLGLTALGYLSPIDPTQLPAYSSAALRGEDVVLSNVTGFDFRVWDPNVPVCGYTPLDELPEGLVPGDPGYDVNAVTNETRGFGAFVDLGCVDPNVPAKLALFNAMDRSSNGSDDDGNGVADDRLELALDPQFVGEMHPRSWLPFGNYVYDPWTLAYEYDGYNQDGDGATDEGADHQDQNSINGADEAITNYRNNKNDDDLDGSMDETDEALLPERETASPYDHPLKVLQVRIRMYESDTRQVKQVSQSIEFAK